MPRWSSGLYRSISGIVVSCLVAAGACEIVSRRTLTDRPAADGRANPAAPGARAQVARDSAVPCLLARSRGSSELPRRGEPCQAATAAPFRAPSAVPRRLLAAGSTRELE